MDSTRRTAASDVTEELGGWLGRTREVESLVGADQANRMAVTLDRPPHFTDGETLPPGWHWLYFHDLVEGSRLGEDGHPARGVTMPPVPLARRMWAAGELTFHQPILVGHRLTRHSAIVDIALKQGRNGSLYFVTLEHDHYCDAVLTLQERQTIVYTDATAAPPPAESATGAGPTAEFGRSWLLDTTALFRYSALTFNGHRIHYDADYARAVEGYPDLVVHGPLLATLLMDAAEQQAPGRLATFAYQARSPLFVSRPFDVGGRVTERGAEVWACAPNGRIAMSATASYHKESKR